MCDDDDDGDSDDDTDVDGGDDDNDDDNDDDGDRDSEGYDDVGGDGVDGLDDDSWQLFLSNSTNAGTVSGESLVDGKRRSPLPHGCVGEA